MADDFYTGQHRPVVIYLNYILIELYPTNKTYWFPHDRRPYYRPTCSTKYIEVLNESHRGPLFNFQSQTVITFWVDVTVCKEHGIVGIDNEIRTCHNLMINTARFSNLSSPIQAMDPYLPVHSSILYRNPSWIVCAYMCIIYMYVYIYVNVDRYGCM